MTEIDWSEQKLTSLRPSDLGNYPNAETVDLSVNQLRRINANWFKRLHRLQELNLSVNKIEKIEYHAFADLVNLFTLDLSSNQLKSVFPQLFTGLDCLQELYLNDNQITGIYPNTFSRFINLTKLNISSNNLRSIEPNTFASMLNLIELNIIDNQIDSLAPYAFSGLQSLEDLDLSGNQLTKIERNFFKGLGNLRALSLSRNMISRVNSDSFVDLVNLDQLYLDGNQLELIERKCIEFLKNATIIDLHDNPWIDSHILSYVNLKTLPKGPLIQFLQVEKKTWFQVQSNWGGFHVQWHLFRSQFYDTGLEKNLNQVSIETNEGDFRVGKLLGRGAYGRVFSVTRMSDKKQFAMKVTPEANSYREIKLLAKIGHPNIIRYFHNFIMQFANKRYMAIITELCEKGDLANLIKKKRNLDQAFSDAEIYTWISQASKGLEYLHSQNIIHRDIKPANILMTDKDVVKICDLGIANITEYYYMDTASCFTFSYISPEMYKCLMDKSQYSFKTDVWSMGCVLYEMMFFTLAFPNGLKNNPSIPDLGNSANYTSVLKKMLVKDAAQRSSSKDICNEFTIIGRNLLLIGDMIGLRF